MGRWGFLFIVSFCFRLSAADLLDCGQILRSIDWPPATESPTYYLEELESLAEQIRSIHGFQALFASSLKQELANKRTVAFMNYLKASGEDFSVIQLDNQRKIVRISSNPKTRYGRIASQLEASRIGFGFDALNNLEDVMSFRGRGSEFMAPFTGAPIIFLSSWILDLEHSRLEAALDHELFHNFFDEKIQAGHPYLFHARFYRSGHNSLDTFYAQFWCLEEILIPLLHFLKAIQDRDPNDLLYFKEIHNDLVIASKLVGRWNSIFPHLQNRAPQKFKRSTYKNLNFRYAMIEYAGETESGIFQVPIFKDAYNQEILLRISEQINLYDEIIRAILYSSKDLDLENLKLIRDRLNPLLKNGEIVAALENQSITKPQVEKVRLALQN